MAVRGGPKRGIRWRQSANSKASLIVLLDTVDGAVSLAAIGMRASEMQLLSSCWIIGIIDWRALSRIIFWVLAFEAIDMI